MNPTASTETSLPYPADPPSYNEATRGDPGQGQYSQELQRSFPYGDGQPSTYPAYHPPQAVPTPNTRQLFAIKVDKNKKGDPIYLITKDGVTGERTVVIPPGAILVDQPGRAGNFDLVTSRRNPLWMLTKDGITGERPPAIPPNAMLVNRARMSNPSASPHQLYAIKVDRNKKGEAIYLVTRDGVSGERLSVIPPGAILISQPSVGTRSAVTPQSLCPSTCTSM